MLKEKPEVLAIIPARGGSKRIPRKNIANLCGKPLIAYSIEVALKTPQITRVVVSTEDREIADVARTYGAMVPFLRPKEMARDSSVVGEAISFTLERLQESGYRPDVVFELYPTSLFRTPMQVKFLVEKLLQGHSYVLTVKPIEASRTPFFSMKKNGVLLPESPSGSGPDVRQQVFFKCYGLFTGQNLDQSNSRGIYLHQVTDPISLIDIDDYGDLYVAEEVIKRNIFDFDLK